MGIHWYFHTSLELFLESNTLCSMIGKDMPNGILSNTALEIAHFAPSPPLPASHPYPRALDVDF